MDKKKHLFFLQVPLSFYTLVVQQVLSNSDSRSNQHYQVVKTIHLQVQKMQSVH